jgi:hypothetical protein
MPNTGRITSANGNSARDLPKPTQSSAKNPACQAGAIAPNSPPEHFTPVSVRPDGREAFLPPLDPGRVYQVTIQGICSKKNAFDALYAADSLGNFVEEHDWLSLYGEPLRDYLRAFNPSLQEDRAAHKYTFRICGSAKRISVRFRLELETLSSFRTEGALAIVVELLPKGTLSPLHFVEREDKILEEYEREQAAAKEKAEREKKAPEERAAVENKLAALRCRAHRENYFLNPDFQQKYARHHLHEISSKLKAEWGSEYDSLMQQPQFKQLAAEQAPEVLQWLEARVNIVRLAEEMTASPQIQKKPKLNQEQVRALKVRRDGIQAEDRIARKKLKAQKLVKGRAELDSIALDPDVKESLSTELDQEILDIGEEEENNGTTL